MLCFLGEETRIDQQHIPTRKHMAAVSRGWKVDYILWDLADSIPYLVPTQFQESFFSIP